MRKATVSFIRSSACSHGTTGLPMDRSGENLLGIFTAVYRIFPVTVEIGENIRNFEDDERTFTITLVINIT
jgi:hypothetical protein